MNNVVQDQDQSQTGADMGAAQPDLFPENDAANNMGGLMQQLAAIPPDQLAALAAQLDPDVRANLAQACYAAMSPDERSAVDTTPGADVQQNMDNANPQRPEQQYQMSIMNAQKRAAANPGMGALADDQLGKWQQRIESLHEDGYLSDADKETYLKRFDKAGDMRFSIILDGHGLLHDDCVAIAALEKARSQSASLSTSVIQSRFGIAKPARPTKDKMDSEDRTVQEECGSRIARLAY